MKLVSSGTIIIEEYQCELTKKLDSLVGIGEDFKCKHYHHYILADSGMINDKCLAIRVPGRTVGDICIDDNYIITEIGIGDDYIVKSYPDDVNKILKQFIGQKLEF